MRLQFVKREIYQYEVENPKATLDMMGKHFGSCFGHDIGKSAIGDNVKKQRNLANLLCHELDMPRTRN